MTTALPKKILNDMQRYPAFFQKVWRACSTIPAGETRTYGWIAKTIGSPKSARAVGQALAKNPFAPTVPCHRVVSSAGALTGYSGPGGVAKKAKMLKAEGWNGHRSKGNPDAR